MLVLVGLSSSRSVVLVLVGGFDVGWVWRVAHAWLMGVFGRFHGRACWSPGGLGGLCGLGVGRLFGSVGSVGFWVVVGWLGFGPGGWVVGWGFFWSRFVVNVGIGVAELSISGREHHGAFPGSVPIGLGTVPGGVPSPTDLAQGWVWTFICPVA